MIFLNHHLTGDCYFVAARWLGVAPVAQVRSARPYSSIPALSDGNQHLEKDANVYNDNIGSGDPALRKKYVASRNWQPGPFPRFKRGGPEVSNKDIFGKYSKKR